LDKDQIQYFYDTNNYKRWHNYRLVAIDGSTARLPNNANQGLGIR
jgi:hypothetical protein